MEPMVLLGGVVLLVVFYMVATFNGIVGSKNRVKRSWSDVLAHLQKKIKVLPALEEKLKEHKEYESGILKQIVDLRQQAGKLSSNSPSPHDLESVEKQFSSVMKSLQVTVENYPDLKSSELYKSVMAEIVEQQEDITAGITIYNRNVEDFNNRLTMFPSSLVNSVLNRENELDSFNDATLNVSSEIGLNPKL